MTMTPAPERRLLPLARKGPHGSRSWMTCEYRCGNACDGPVPNQSGHHHVSDEITSVVRRRSLLQGGAVGAGILVLGHAGAAAAAEPAPAAGATELAKVQADLGKVRFRPVRPNVRDAITVPDGFRHDVLARWGDRVLPDAPAFDAWRQTPEAAAGQFGYNCDYVGVVPVSRRKACLVVNHEYTDPQLMFPEGVYDDATKIKIEMANHGMSVVMIKRGRTPGSWLRIKPAKAPLNRRIHTGTVFKVTGPAAGHALLRTTADPTGTRVRGTLNNCAGGTTPWGTVLSGEENFNQYFSASGETDPAYAEAWKRYGIGAGGRGWHTVDPRFDLSKEPNEPNRFGWIVEVDPKRPLKKPRKLTMLGRFKHEGANVVIAKNGRAVVYMGDDERGDYLYKYVSRDKYVALDSVRAQRHNRKLLEQGTLYVARLTGDGPDDGRFDGTGEWIPLTSDTTSYVDGMSVAEVLVHTRLAADRVAPTRMDRPEDVEPNPVNGRVYAALTNNSRRGSTFPVDEANPLSSSMVRSALGAPLTEAGGNRNGYVLEMAPDRDNHTARSFTWNLFLVCGDPEAPETWFGGFDKSKVSPISCPDNVAFDGEGNLWISTDGNALGSNDGLFRVPVAGPERGRVQQFLTVPRGAETCGPLIVDRTSLFVAVQHPGEVDGATFEAPASTWPHTDDFPRPSVCVVYRAQ